MRIQDLQKISDYEWEIPTSYRSGMHVPVRLFASRRILEAIIEDKSLEQAMNAAMLPGVVGRVLVMPDVHQGYGFPIGGVAAMKDPDGVISPGAIGYDINCGVRLLASSIEYEAVRGKIPDLATAIYKRCPVGAGKEGIVRLTKKELHEVAIKGAEWALERGYAEQSDIRRTEDGGRLPGADPLKVSERAKERGRPQLGSVGSGNHFIEVDVVDQTFDEEAARAMGLFPGMLCVLIHSGSRGFGHQICTDYVQRFQKVIHKYGIRLPDRELVCAPIDSPEGQSYIAAMHCAANFAFANRQILAYGVRRAFEEVLAGKVSDVHLRQVYDVAHNIGKFETHLVDGKPLRVCVHRKGATRAFPPGFEGLPSEYQHIGQPVLVPGSMGTASWVLVGTHTAMEKSFGSFCHGAGRMLSRRQAKKRIEGSRLRMELESHGIAVRARSLSGLAEEAPIAYKDVDEVVKVVQAVGIARKVARLRPVAVIKG